MKLALALILVAVPAAAQNKVPCWFVPNGVNTTMQCANGFWQTTTPEGDVITGNGMPDPNASMQGSRIGINPATGGPVTAPGQGPSVAPPTQIAPTYAPGAANAYGLPTRQDN